MASRFRGLGFRGISMKRAADQGITFTDRVPGPGSLALKRQGLLFTKGAQKVVHRNHWARGTKRESIEITSNSGPSIGTSGDDWR